jgi:hypothetical protein
MSAPISIAWDELSSSAQAAFQFAAGIAEIEVQGSEATVSVPAVSSRMLLVGIADAHPDPASVNRNPLLDLLAHYSLGRVDMDAELAREWRRRDRPWNPARHRRFTLVDLPRLRGHAPQVMQAARDLMLEVANPPERLPLRFLFGGILKILESGAYLSLESLLGHRADLPAIREAYPKFLALPDEVRFADFLGDQFPSTAPFVGTVSDRVVGEVDLLGRGKLIGDVARWLSVRHLQTPLAIGLFGDWGSGKSFFIARLQEEIDRIHTGARRRRESAFCRHIVQVNFNAWLYSDSRIWPSLATQVFKAVAGLDPEAPSASSMEELRAHWAKETPRYRAAEQNREKAVEREDQARKSVRQLDDQVVKAHDELRKSAEQLGHDAMNVVEASDALKKAGSTAKLTASAIKGLSPRAKVILAVLALVGLIAVAVAVIAPSVLTRGLAIVAFAVPFAGTIAKVVSPILSALDQYREELDLRAKQQEAREELEDATTARGDAESQVEALSRIGLLEAYSSGQAALWASRQRLGEVTEIRQSFTELSTIITQTQRERRARLSRNAPVTEDTNGGSQAGPLPIDRIVVYIDDLDRCPPDLVVRVLEACKLLMDLEHFVVIVGVDSRWLLRSLEIRFKELLSADGATSAEAQTDAGWAATPQNYLEKIFQFSLMLPQITPEGYERLVLNLFPSEHEGGPNDGEDESAGTVPTPPSKEERDEASARREAGEHEATVDSTDDRPADLLLNTEELQTIQALAPLIRTPRSVKRLTNIYRLIRVTYGESHLLQDDAYVVVLLLLGIVVGYPRQSATVLTGLDKSDPETDWDVFVRSLEPVPDSEAEKPSYSNNIRTGMSEAEAEDWARMWHDLKEIKPSAEWRVQVGAFRDWLQRVAEYTFHPWSRRELAPVYPTAVHDAGEESATPP